MFTLSEQPIDAQALKAQVKNPRSGGFVNFEGWVRNHNKTAQDETAAVTELHYEAHEKLAQQVGQQIIDQAMQQFDINAAVCCHRVGQLQIGDMAIWVGVSADHRQAAFAACEFILNQTKAQVPIWKKEHYKNGDSGWVEANL
ncbi:molybdenum cofactor biosynthesis protein MoaE [Marinicella meishanensis]|uniref:molybdenum cofactor biosynthesis protein MoaE n=1 Tax=Marinicella meishanensis TaxID=2873263 RepID=UPI001CBEEA95|nr:molybdenum cofactor biosynthesis protein MoaE [Marinicella sp. NBU2979]